MWERETKETSQPQQPSPWLTKPLANSQEQLCSPLTLGEWSNFHLGLMTNKYLISILKSLPLQAVLFGLPLVQPVLTLPHFSPSPISPNFTSLKITAEWAASSELIVHNGPCAPGAPRPANSAPLASEAPKTAPKALSLHVGLGRLCQTDFYSVSHPGKSWGWSWKNEKKAEINSAELKGLVQLGTGMGKFTNQTVHEPVWDNDT